MLAFKPQSMRWVGTGSEPTISRRETESPAGIFISLHELPERHGEPHALAGGERIDAQFVFKTRGEDRETETVTTVDHL